MPHDIRGVVVSHGEDESHLHERQHQRRQLHLQRRVADRQHVGGTQGVQLRFGARRSLRKHRFHDLHTPTSHVLHRQRHPAEHHDVSAAPVNLLLHAGAEGADRRGRVAIVQDLPAERSGKHTEDLRPHSSAR